MKLRYAFVVLVFCVAFAYLPSVRHEFVSFDDHLYVYENDHVLGGLSADNVLWGIKSCGYAYNWHPLTWISLQADATVVRKMLKKDDNAALSHVMHAHNVLLHALNAGIMFLLIVLLNRQANAQRDYLKDDDNGGAFWPAWTLPFLFAMLWAVHPLRVEPVCWVSERKELLCVFWMLLSLVFWGLRTEANSDTVKPRCCYCLSLVFFALAILAKPLAVTLPATLLAWDWIVRGRPFRQAFTSVIPCGLVSILACGLTLAAQTEPVDVGNHFPIWDRMMMTLGAPITYLWQGIYPAGLSAFYPPHPRIGWIGVPLGMMLVAAMLWIVVRWIRKREGWTAICAFGVVWSYVSLIPMLGIIKVGDQPHSDRYTYWAGCALTCVCCLIVRRLGKELETLAVKIAAGALVLLFVATRDRIPVWRNSCSLYMDAVPKCWTSIPVVSLSREFRRQGREGLRRAEMLLRDALGHVDYCEIHAEYANLMSFKAEKSSSIFSDASDSAFVEVRMEAEGALAANPSLGAAYEALGVISLKEGKWQKALEHLEKAIECGEDPKRINSEIEICRERLATRKGKKDVQGK